MKDLIISFLLVYIQIQRKIIIYLVMLLTSKNIAPKKDNPISKKYQKLEIDPRPIIDIPEKLDYKKLITEYEKQNGKPLKPIRRHKNSKCSVPDNIICPKCNAPHDYLYDNNGGKGQFFCKICNHTFFEKTNFSKSPVYKCPFCKKTLVKIKQRNDFNIWTGQNKLNLH